MNALINILLIVAVIFIGILYGIVVHDTDKNDVKLKPRKYEE